jgi:hypothetical protein
MLILDKAVIEQAIRLPQPYHLLKWALVLAVEQRPLLNHSKLLVEPKLLDLYFDLYLMTLLQATLSELLRTEWLEQKSMRLD